MSEPITWRNVAAPNLAATAAFMQTGGESIDRGMTALANVAKGIADEQKGVELSSAIGALGKAKTDEERSALFDAQAARLGARGIDLKDLIAADQERHKTLQGDTKFATDQKAAVADLLTKELTQAGIKTENKTNETKFNHLLTEQAFADKTAEAELKKIASAIENDAASRAAAYSNIQSDRVMDALHTAQMNQVGKESKNQDREREAAALFFSSINDPANIDTDSAGNKSVNTKRLYDALAAKGVNPKDANAAKEIYDTAMDKDQMLKAAADNADKEEKYAFAEHEQKLRDESKMRAEALAATKATLDTDTSWLTGNFGQDKQYNSGAALVTAAYGTKYTDASGKTKYLPAAIVNELVKNNSNDGDLKEKAFVINMKKRIAELSKE